MKLVPIQVGAHIAVWTGDVLKGSGMTLGES